MDKTEMYNKIINAIDVLSRIQGEEVWYNNDIWEIEREKPNYSISETTVIPLEGNPPRVFVKNLEVTDKLDSFQREGILSKMRRIYEKQQDKLNEQFYEEVKSYLNSFVGK